jgi:hypothetical protein
MADGFNFSFEARLSRQSHHLASMRAGVVWGDIHLNRVKARIPLIPFLNHQPALTAPI